MTLMLLSCHATPFGKTIWNKLLHVWYWTYICLRFSVCSLFSIFSYLV